MCVTRIKEIRLNKNITQKKIAELVGLSQAEISRKENGKTSLDLDNLKKFASVLNVPISELLEETSDKAV